jgi:peptidoglycan/LPS O-acetylase OafA/YrhL
MSGNAPIEGGQAMPAFSSNRRAMRRTAAGICGVVAAIYLAIAAGATSIEPSDDMDLVVFGVGAASIFLVGAALLMTQDRRPLWAAGAVLQLMIGGMYLVVSSDRTPAFEVWGLGLRVLQVPLLVLLVLLAVRPVEDAAGRDASTRSAVEGDAPSARTPTSGVT